MGMYNVQGLTKEEIIQEMDNLMSWERVFILEHYAKKYFEAELNVSPSVYIKNKKMEDILSLYPIEDIKTYLEMVNTHVLPDYLTIKEDYVTGMEQSKAPF